MNTQRHSEIEALAGDAAWVRALARQLVGDSHQADDLVQEAFTAALAAERGPRGPISGWLAGIVRNVAGGMRRSGARRMAREQIAARAQLQRGIQDPVERLEQQRLVTEAVLGLGEPYRSTVIRRFFGGLPQREIARQDGVAVATVNSRLTRALEQLRRRLDKRHGGDRSAWVAVLTPLATIQKGTGSLVLGVSMIKKSMALAAAVGLVASFVILREDDPGPPGSAAVSAASPSEEPAVAAGFVPADDPPRVVVAPSDGTETEGGSLSVRVVDGLTGEPVPGATIFYLDTLRTLVDPDLLRRQHERRMLKPADPISAWSSLYPSFVSGPDGRTDVPLPGPMGAQLGAHLGSCFASGSAEEGQREPVELRLFPTKVIEVQVVDAANQPLADVPVAIQQLTLSVNGDIHFNIATAVSRAPGGLARIEYYSERTILETNNSLVVVLDLPLAERVEVPLSDHMDAWPTEPLTLVCPPVGSATVEVTGPDGEPMPDGTLVSLSLPGDGLVSTGSLSRRLSQGKATFWPVGLGGSLKAWAALRWDQDPIGVLGTGPRNERQSARIHLRLKGRLVEIAGRLRRDDGTPVAGEAFHVAVLDLPELAHRSHTILTDAKGCFRLTLAEDANRLAGSSLRLRPFRTQGGYNDRWKTGVTIPLPGIPASGQLDLGEVVLPRLRSLFTGQVVDRTGKPIPDVIVRLAAPLESGGSNAGRWQGRSTAERTGRDGRFELGGTLPDGDLWIQAEVEGPWYHEPVRVFGPTRGLRIVMTQAGILEGSLLLDPEIPADRLRVQLWPDIAGPPVHWGVGSRNWIGANRDADGHFWFKGLRPGSYTLLVGAGIQERTVVRIRGIGVQPGLTRDPRLDPLDLRGRYSSIHLMVSDEEGRSVNAAVIARYPGGGRSQVGLSRWRLILPAQVREELILVEADGFFPVALEPFDGPKKLVLERGLPVALRYAGETPLPVDPLFLVATLEAAFMPQLLSGERALPPRWSRRRNPSRGKFSSEGRLQLHVREPGVHRLRWNVLAGDGSSREILQTPPVTVMVNGKTDPPHDVTPNEASLAQVLEELRALQRSGSTSSASDNE